VVIQSFHELLRETRRAPCRLRVQVPPVSASVWTHQVWRQMKTSTRRRNSRITRAFTYLHLF
jgi:hypothetical protein